MSISSKLRRRQKKSQLRLNTLNAANAANAPNVHGKEILAFIMQTDILGLATIINENSHMANVFTALKGYVSPQLKQRYQIYNHAGRYCTPHCQLARKQQVCTICVSDFSDFNDDRLLQSFECGHVFCHECITQLSRYGGMSIRCPNCNQVPKTMRIEEFLLSDSSVYDFVMSVQLHNTNCWHLYMIIWLYKLAFYVLRYLYVSGMMSI